MAKKQERVFLSNSPKETFSYGKLLGEQAEKGEIYCLQGDLGAGKTLFAQGFALGLGVTELVSSPTFTLIQEYSGGRFPLFHFDVYRLEEEEEMFEIGYEDYFYGDGVCLVEWAGNVEGLIPREAVWVKMERDMAKGNDFRKIIIECLIDR